MLRVHIKYKTPEYHKESLHHVDTTPQKESVFICIYSEQARDGEKPPEKKVK